MKGMQGITAKSKGLLITADLQLASVPWKSPFAKGGGLVAAELALISEG